MLIKIVFLTFLILFSILSFLIEIPPGTIVTETLNLSLPYFNIITTNLLNGIIFGTIAGLATFLIKRKTQPTPPPTYTSYSSPSFKIENTLADLKSETESNLTEIKGIGPKRSLELELAGVKSITDLAKRSPKHLAEKTGIPIKQISKWIIEANKLTEN